MFQCVNDSKFNPRRLTQARGDRSFEEIAAAADVSHQTARNWEAGKGQPDATALNAIARLTGKPLDFFFVPTRATA